MDQGAAAKAVGVLRESPAASAGRFPPFSLLPLVFSGADRMLFERSAACLSSIARKALSALVSSERMRAALLLPPEMEDAIGSAVQMANGAGKRALIEEAAAFLRFDALCRRRTSGEAELSFCEINSNAIGGLAEARYAEEATESLDVFRRFKAERDLAGMGVSIRERWADIMAEMCHEAMGREADEAEHGLNGKGRPHLCFLVLFDSAEPNVAELDWIGGALAKRGFRISVADVRSLEIGSDGFFRSRRALSGESGIRIDFAFNYLIWSDLMRHRADCAAFLNGFTRSGTRLFPSPLCFMLQDRSFFAFLCSQADDAGGDCIFSKDEHMFLESCLADTFMLSGAPAVQSRISDLKRRKDAWLLKPAGSYGGRGIVFGSSLDQEEWEKLVDMACGLENGLRMAAQAREKCQQVETIAFSPDRAIGERRLLRIRKANSVLGLFALGGEFAGLYVRAGFGDVVSGMDSAYCCASYSLPALSYVPRTA